MPSTTPDLRIATVRGFAISGSARLVAGKASRASASDFGSGFGAPAGVPADGPLALFPSTLPSTFPSAGHMASKLAGCGRALGPLGPVGAPGAAGALGAAGGVRQSNVSDVRSSDPGGITADAGAPCGWRGDSEISSSSGASGLGSDGAKDWSSPSSKYPPVLDSGSGSTAKVSDAALSLGRG